MTKSVCYFSLKVEWYNEEVLFEMTINEIKILNWTEMERLKFGKTIPLVLEGLK